MIEMLKKLIGDKKEYKMMMARVEELPDDYQFVFKKFKTTCGISHRAMGWICCTCSMN